MRYTVEDGAVFFVDILGMSALTRGHVDLSCLEEKIDLSIYRQEGVSGPAESKNLNQHIAAWILLKFREILGDISCKYDVNISQLSDCAFIWSKKPFQVILAASEFMWKSMLIGILCRGGIAYGEIIIPRSDGKEFGAILLGSAVTNAATLERSGKGGRIFTDSDSAHHLMRSFPKGSNAINAHRVSVALFQPLLNPLDFSITDEFKWYLYYDLKALISRPKEINPGKQSMYMAALVSSLRHSPFYAWNVLNKEGRLHISDVPPL